MNSHTKLNETCAVAETLDVCYLTALAVLDHFGQEVTLRSCVFGRFLGTCPDDAIKPILEITSKCDIEDPCEAGKVECHCAVYYRESVESGTSGQWLPEKMVLMLSPYVKGRPFFGGATNLQWTVEGVDGGGYSITPITRNARHG